MSLEYFPSYFPEDQNSDSSEASALTFRRELELAGGVLALGVAAKFSASVVPELVSRLSPALSQAPKLLIQVEKSVRTHAGEKLFGLVPAADEIAQTPKLLSLLKSAQMVKSDKNSLELPSFNVVGKLKNSGEEFEAVEAELRSIPSKIRVSPYSWLARLYEEKKPAIVRIDSEDATSGGSGFFVDSQKNLLATNYHVIAGVEEQNHVVRLFNGRSFMARTLAYDQEADLAVLKIVGNHPNRFQALELGTPLQMSSKRAAAIGYPCTNRNAPVISPGSLDFVAYSGSGRLHFNMQTYHGNSGGPIFDRDGRVVSVLKSGVGAGSYSSASSIGANVEHLRTMVNLVHSREIMQGPLEIETEILHRGRRIFQAQDWLEMQKKPELLHEMKEALAVRVLKQTES